MRAPKFPERALSFEQSEVGHPADPIGGLDAGKIAALELGLFSGVARIYPRLMKARTLPLVALVALVVLGSASTATAQAPIPKLQTTAPYKSLKNYVNMLQGRSATPTTAQRKQVFRSQLVAKRNAANAKAKSIFNLTIARIKKKDDVQERAQVKRIRQNQKTQVTALNASLAAQLSAIAASERLAVDRVNDRYARRINPLGRERDALRRELKKTKNPIRRMTLTNKINKLQADINALYQSKQTDLNAIEARFDSRQDAANNRFQTRIKNVKASAKRQILQARRAWKKLFRDEHADAKEQRAENFELISELREEGTGYIQQMPLRTN